MVQYLSLLCQCLPLWGVRVGFKSRETLRRTLLLEAMVLLCDRRSDSGRIRVRCGRVGIEGRHCLLERGVCIELGFERVQLLEAVVGGGFECVDLGGSKSSPGVRGALDKGTSA